MKKLILLLIFFNSFCNLKAQTNIYHPFPDSNATWGSYYDDADGYDYNVFYLDGDTAIYGTNYSKIYNFINWDVRHYVGAYRQDTLQRRVYARVPDFMYPLPFHYQDTGEVLLYDFSLQIGDSVKIPSAYYHFNYLKVANIDSIIINGNYRKVLEVAPVMFDPGVHSYWIEGIGSNKGLFWPHYNFESSVCFLECMTQDGSTLYTTQSTGNCPYIINPITSILIDNDINLSPNPTSNQIQINIKSNVLPAHLFFYNDNGEIVKQILLKDTKSLIDISELYSGFYFLIVQNENNIYTQKLIKL